MMDIIGTSFSLTLGSWRLRLNVAVEDIDAPEAPRARPPHRMRVVPHDEYQHRRG